MKKKMDSFQEEIKTNQAKTGANKKKNAGRNENQEEMLAKMDCNYDSESR
jgi:hypothetical protein